MQEERTIGYPVPNGQAWKHTSNIVWTELLIFLDVYVCIKTHMHVIIINEKRGNLKDSWGKVYERILWEERLEKSQK